MKQEHIGKEHKVIELRAVKLAKQEDVSYFIALTAYSYYPNNPSTFCKYQKQQELFCGKF